MRRLFVMGAALLALGACGGKSDEHVTAATTGSNASAAPTSTQHATFNTTLVNGKPHFASPQDAMRFLADAWNRDDQVNLKHVTDPSARDELQAMHGVAINLRLNHCDLNPGGGDYTCYFDHDYPPHPSTTMAMEDTTGVGKAVFLVGPADTPGWYMTVFESCS